MLAVTSTAPFTAIVLHLGVNTRTVYGLDPFVTSLALFWFVVLMAVVWRRH